MNPESRRIEPSEPESEVRMSKRSADFALPGEGTAEDLTAEAASAAESGERETPPAEPDMEPLTKEEATRLIAEMGAELKKMNLTPQERNNLERRKMKLERFLPAAAIQEYGTEVDNDAVRRSDDFESVFGATLDDESVTEAAPPAPGLPPKSDVGDRHSKILSGHLREAKQGGFTQIELAEAHADADAGLVDSIDNRLRALNAEAKQLMKDFRAAVDETQQRETAFKETYHAAKQLIHQAGLRIDDPIKFYVSGELPQKGWFQKRTDERFVQMREKLMAALGDFADTAARWRRLGHNVPVPGAHDLISANMQPVPDLPPETAKMRAASITIEFNKLTKERADLIKRFSS